MTEGYVSQIYLTVQGEGIFVGEEQLFVRLAGCPLRCAWCDTPESLFQRGHAPRSVQEVADRLLALNRGGRIRVVSLTGGEPLHQVDFLGVLLPVLKSEGFRTYLETAGIHHAAFCRVVRDCDTVSMDIKLPSALGRAYWGEHEAFLRIGAGKTFVKVVVSESSRDEEVEAAFELVARCAFQTPVVIQPVTPQTPLTVRLSSLVLGEGPQPRNVRVILPPSPLKVLDWWERGRRRLPDVRLIPQMHLMWGLP